MVLFHRIAETDVGLQNILSNAEMEAESIWPFVEQAQCPYGIRRVVCSIIAGAVFWFLCTSIPALWRPSGAAIPIFWPANGILMAFLIVRPRNRWWIWLLAAWLGGAIAGFKLDSSLAMSCAFATCNVIEVFIAALLTRRMLDRRRTRDPKHPPDLASAPILIQFIIFAALLAPLISALLASTFYSVDMGASLAHLFAAWFPSHALGMVVMTPLTLALWNPSLRGLFTGIQLYRTAGMLLLILAASLVNFGQSRYHVAFLLLPLLMLVVFQVGILGAVIATFEITMVGAFFTLHGSGPFWMEKGATLHRSIFLLQFSVLVLLASIVPFAGIVERQRLLRKKLEQGITRYQLLADNSQDIVVLCNLEGRRLYVSPAVQEVLGWTQEQWTNEDPAEWMHWEDVAGFRQVLKEILHGEGRRVLRYRTMHKDGQYVWMEAIMRVLSDETTGEPNAFVANCRDISLRVESERKLAEAQEQALQQAQRDSLTQLANRRCFDEALEMEWRRGRRAEHSLALLMIDVDHFKGVNDTYGHRAGDHCLQAIAAVLREVTRRPGDIAARYGGEEFAILLPDVTLASAVVMGERLRQKIRELEFDAGTGRKLHLTISVGVAAYMPCKNVRPEVLVDSADRAIYAAKQAGRDCVMPEDVDREFAVALLPVH